MASKQLGKLKQWGREVISSKEKTLVNEEFKQVEQDVDLRRVGIERLQAACSEYHGYLQKKKEYSSIEAGVKMLPVDALGAVMMSHGEEFGQDSAFGQTLVKLGRAHCKIATLQETFASTFRDTYIASLNDELEDIAEYTAQRRKLESRRLTYDAAVTKASKAKKEKEIKEAEEEVDFARQRYEETSADVRTRMRAIQDNELRQLRDLTGLLTLELGFATQYLEVLKVTQENWVDEGLIQRFENQPEISAPHDFAHGRTTPSISSTSRTSIPSRPSSAGSKRSSEGDGDNLTRRSSIKKISSPSPTAPVRPSSRNSVGSTGTAHDAKRRRDSAASQSETALATRRMSVAGWASNAVSSFSRKEPKKEKIKDNDKNAIRAFANLENESDESHDDEGSLEPESRSRSFTFGTSALSKMLGQGSRTSSQNNTFSSSNSSFGSVPGNKTSTASRKLMRALYDFDGSTDQLSFKVGDEIAIIYEGRDGWYMGELSGQRGLFPASYTEDVQSRVRPPPLLPPRQPSNLAQRAQIETSFEDDASIISQDLYSPNPNVVAIGLYDEPFSKLRVAKSPMALDVDHKYTPTDEEDEERRGLFNPPDTPAFFDSPVQPLPNGVEIGNREGNTIFQPANSLKQPAILPPRLSTKKAPPPPPARRSAGSGNAVATSTPSSSATSAVPITFPSPPSVPKRPNSRAKSADPPSSVSPFDN